MCAVLWWRAVGGCLPALPAGQAAAHWLAGACFVRRAAAVAKPAGPRKPKLKPASRTNQPSPPILHSVQSMAAAAAAGKDPDILHAAGGGHDSAANLADLGLQVRGDWWRRV